MDFPKMLDEAKDLPDIFEVVKAAVQARLKKSRGGLMLGVADLGNQPQGFFGGYFQVGSNIIVINRNPLQRIKDTQPELYKPYVFHVLLHEYLHTIGFMDEDVVRPQAYQVTKALFGEEHLATQIAKDPFKFIPNLVYPYVGWQPSETNFEIIAGFDRSSTDYIQ